MSTASSDEFGIGTGAAVGAATWVVGLIVTFLLGILGLSTILELLVGLGGPIDGTLAGYFLIQAWFVGGMGAAGGSGFPIFVIVPILLLIGAGFYVASQETGLGAKAGVGVAAGYLALAAVSGLLLFVTGAGGDIVELLLMIVVAGVVFPLIFAGIGGAIADQV